MRHQRVHQKPTDERENDEADVNEETDGADDADALERKEVGCPSGKEDDASPIQTESEKAESPPAEETERVEEEKEKQNPENTDVKMDSAEDPQADGAGQEELRIEEPLIHVASDATSGGDSEPAKTQRTEAQEENSQGL